MQKLEDTIDNKNIEIMKHIILDKTDNSDRPYIGEGGENCELLENAMVFDNLTEAEDYIYESNWQSWAVAKPLSEC